MLANTSAYPESANYPNDGNGSDHDSLGLFQQRQVRFQRVCAGGFDALLVHEGVVQPPDARIRVAPADLGDDVPDLLLGEVAQVVEGAVDAAVGGDLMGGDPGAVDVAVEVIARADRGVEGQLGGCGVGALRHTHQGNVCARTLAPGFTHRVAHPGDGVAPIAHVTPPDAGLSGSVRVRRA